jgi:hypothetical protein
MLLSVVEMNPCACHGVLTLLALLMPAWRLLCLLVTSPTHATETVRANSNMTVAMVLKVGAPLIVAIIQGVRSFGCKAQGWVAVGWLDSSAYGVDHCSCCWYLAKLEPEWPYSIEH